MGPAWRIALVPAGLLALALAFLQVSFVSDAGSRASREIAQSATLVYISLRAVNAALSVSQEIEIGANIGASASAQPLKVLEPVDDTIERVAGVVFAIAALSWILSVAFQPVSVLGFAALGGSLIALSVCWRWSGPARMAQRGAGLGIVLAVLLPLIYAGGVALGHIATESLQAEATERLDEVADEAKKLIGRAETGATAEPGAGWVSGMIGTFGEVRDQVSRFSDAADYYWTNADTVLNSAFVLIAVFVLRIIVMPLALLLLAWRLIRGAI